jgi:hypothetical protein
VLKIVWLNGKVPYVLVVDRYKYLVMLLRVNMIQTVLMWAVGGSMKTSMDLLLLLP